jgi:hypothetical protein
MSDIYKEFGVDVLRDSENAGPTAAEVRMAQEIKRLRARVEVLERVREAALQYLQAKTVEGARYALNALKEAKP